MSYDFEDDAPTRGGRGRDGPSPSRIPPPGSVATRYKAGHAGTARSHFDATAVGGDDDGRGGGRHGGRGGDGRGGGGGGRGSGERTRGGRAAPPSAGGGVTESDGDYGREPVRGPPRRRGGWHDDDGDDDPPPPPPARRAGGPRGWAAASVGAENAEELAAANKALLVDNMTEVDKLTYAKDLVLRHRR
jgi:hypothetical protein